MNEHFKKVTAPAGKKAGYRFATMLMELEQRIAFDGAGAHTLDDIGDMEPDPAAGGQSGDTGEVDDFPGLVDALSQTGAAGEAPQAPAKQIIFIDSRVEEPEKLLSEFDGDYEAVTVGADEDGVAVIAETLAGRVDVDAIHILSHGRAGSLILGSSELTYDSITGEYADELNDIGASLSENADILIYGCDFAEGPEGARAAQALAALTGADVAASTGDTGAAELGGDWVLEYETGKIETATLSAEDWGHLLEPPTLSSRGPTLVENGSFSPTTGWTQQSGAAPESNRAGVYTSAGESPDGGTVVEVEGAIGSTWVQTTVANTVIGTTYEISLYAITRTPQNEGDRGILSVGSDADNLTMVASFTTDGTWQLYTATFTATSTSTILRITSDGSVGGTRTEATDGVGLIIDGVAVREVITDPNHTASYTENDAGVAVVNQDLAIRDSDSTTVTSATVTISNHQPGDELFISGTLPAGITASSYNAATGALTLTGSAGVWVYEMALDLVQFRSMSDDPSTTPRTINIVVNDGSGDSNTAVTTLSVTPVNDAPVLDGAPELTYTALEDEAAPSGAVGSLISTYTGGISDPESGALKGIAITGNSPSNGIWWYSTDNGTTWTQVGTVSATNALLLADDPQTRLYFQPTTANYNGSGGSSALTFRAWDQTSGTNGTKVSTSSNGGTTAFSTATDTISVTVSPVNDPPVMTDVARSLTAFNEDGHIAAPEGAVGVAVTLATLNINNGNVSDVDAGAVKGIAIVGANTAHGIWWYSIDNGGTWRQLGSVSEANALLLSNATTSRIYFQSTADYHGTIDDALTIRAWDQTQGTNGDYFNVSANGNDGATAFSSATDTVAQTVNAVADIVNDAVTTQEDVSKTFNPITGADETSGADNFENSGRIITAVNGTAITAGGSAVAVPNGTVTLAADGATLTYTPTADFNGTSTFSYTVTSGGVTETANITMTVTAVADAPRIDLDATANGTDFSGNYDQDAVAIGRMITLTDPENDNIASVTITLQGATEADSLSLSTAVSGITASYNSATGVLTLTGNTTLANYQTALNNVRFMTSNAAPESRTIVVSAQSGADPRESNTATATITLIDSDKDGVANTADIDDDNDGIIDTVDGGITSTETALSLSSGSSHTVTQTGELNEIVLNIYTLDNSLNVTVNGVPIATDGAQPPDNELQYYTPSTGNDVAFLDNSTYGSIWTMSGNASNPLIQIRINNLGEVSLFGSRTNGGPLEAMKLLNGSLNIVPLSDSSGNTVITIGQSNISAPTHLTGSIVVSTISNVDGDPVENRLDIDSDNDGITDNVEAQTTSGYILPGGVDADNDGLDDAYDADVGNRTDSASRGLVPVDSDGDGVADYRDSDSDADGTADIAERGGGQPTTVTSTTDSDDDGLLDIFEGSDVNDGFDPNDENINADRVYNLADSDNDTAANGSNAAPLAVDLDYRDNDVNDAPVNTVPGSQTVNEDTDLTFSSAGGNAITVGDVDSAMLTVTLTVTNGTLTLSGRDGLAFTSGDGTSDGTMTFAGTAAAINAALDGAVYRPVADYNGAAQLTLVTSDGSLMDSDTVAVSVTAVADIAADTASTDEDTAVTINVLANDSFENAGRMITAVNGTAITAGGAAVAVADGTVSLTADGRLVFTPALDYNGDTSFTYTVTSGGVTETATASVTVRAVNDAPALEREVDTQLNVSSAVPPLGPAQRISISGAVLDAVEEGGSGAPAEGVINDAVNGTQSLNGTGDIGVNGVVANVVSQIGGWRNYGQLSDTELIDIAQISSSITDGSRQGLEKQFSVETLVRGGRIYILISSENVRAEQIRVTLADGRALPDWLTLTRQGVVIATPPAGVPNIDLGIQVTVDGADRHDTFRIDLSTGAIESHAAEESANLGGILFSKALEAEAVGKSLETEMLATALFALQPG